MNKSIVSILEMNQGAFLEITDHEMSKITDNILDPNTKATAKRKLTLTFEFIPDDSRTNWMVHFVAKPTLATTNPTVTSLYVAGESSTGEVRVVEMVPQIPGQMSVDGEEQSAPPMLRLINY